MSLKTVNKKTNEPKFVTTPREFATEIARWWSGVIREFAEYTKKCDPRRQTFTDEQFVRFETELVTSLLKEIKFDGKWELPEVRMDYDPNPALARALEVGGFGLDPSQVIPNKTASWITIKFNVINAVTHEFVMTAYTEKALYNFKLREECRPIAVARKVCKNGLWS